VDRWRVIDMRGSWMRKVVIKGGDEAGLQLSKGLYYVILLCILRHGYGQMLE